MALTLLYQYNAGGTQFSVYGYKNIPANAVNFGFLWLGAPPATTPDLAATWNQQGLYAFFPAANDYDWAAFSSSLYALYQQYAKYNIRFAWTDNAASQLISGIYVSNGKVSNTSNLVFAQFALLVPNQKPYIRLNTLQDGFVIENKNLALLPDRFDGSVAPINLTSEINIKISETLQGVLVFTSTMSTAQLAACHAGVHFFNSQSIQGSTTQQDYNYYFSFDYPVLNATAGVSLQGCVDMLAPQDPVRTNFSFTDNTPVSSFIPTRAGHFLSLQPTTTTISGGNGFTLVNYPKEAQETGLLCFSIQGTYTLILDHASGRDATANNDQLLCGISGTEHIAIVPQSKDYAGDLIDFIPGQLAFAPVFPVLTQDQANTDSSSLLQQNAFCSTSWVQVRKNTGPPSDAKVNYYYCQPADAALFNRTVSDTFLQVFDAEAGNTFDATQPTPVAKVFPMVPYAAAAESGSSRDFPGTISDFEYQILNPFRKNKIVTKQEISNRQAAGIRYRTRIRENSSLANDDYFTTTPQGLLVHVETDEQKMQFWETLVLATNQDTSVPANALLQLQNVNATIQSAFQTNQQFLVVSLKDSFGTLSDQQQDHQTQFNNTISIAGWPFHLDIGSNDYGDYSNVMIFKFCSGALTDRIQNTQSWTQPGDFVGDANEQMMLSRWMANYCNNADIEYGKGNAAYEKIHTIIHDVNWNGILALNVNIGLSDFPEDIKGLLGGIDVTRFKANHFGVEVNHITIKDNIVQTPASSSLFGLIDYTDPGYINEQQPPGATNVDYDFKVLKLLVLFNNSAIVDFKSKLQLTINTLFSDSVVQTSQQAYYNTILLDGSYENHNGHKSYIFNETGDQLFTISNNVLQVVEIVKVQFSTLSTDQHSDDVQSRFSIWGYLHFASLPGLDAFSFDKLAFSNLGIRMNFSDKNPAVRTFIFDPQVIGFDISNSAGRPQSFAYNYPLAISSLLYSDGSQMPKDIGYLNVSSPLDTASKAIPQSWYALSFNLNLGTLGALASKVGLTANLILVWGTGLPNQSSTDFAAAVFIRLPGTGGSSSFFSLQNVLKLSIGSIKLYADTQSSPGNTAYLIKFNNIALKVLSKQLPPNGKIGMFLFGDPGKHAQPTDDPTQSSLGWYAAYQKDKKKDKLLKR
jgi:hypothetical protein